MIEVIVVVGVFESLGNKITITIVINRFDAIVAVVIVFSSIMLALLPNHH
jgi:hypothetical protein